MSEIKKTFQNKWFWACGIILVTVISMLPQEVQQPIVLMGTSIFTSIWIISEREEKEDERL